MPNPRREQLLALKAAGIRYLPKPAMPALPDSSAMEPATSIGASSAPAVRSASASIPAAASPTGDRAAALAAVRAELGDCTRCRLCEKRTQIVFGAGDPEAKLMFVGEGPGQDEDLQGEPFVGRAGKLLKIGRAHV